MTQAVLILPDRDTLTGGTTTTEVTSPVSSPVTTPTPTPTPAPPPPPPPPIYKNLTEQNDNYSLTIGELSAFPEGLRGLAGNDLITGSSGNEQINGNTGDDTLFGGNGDDILLGGRDNDVLFGENGNDILNGNLGNDLVVGGEDNDIVRGGQGEDILIGSTGNDTLIGDMDQDLLFGGESQDLYVLRTDASAFDPNQADLIFGFNSSEDSIGVTNGLTASNITLEVFTIDLTTQLSIFKLFPDQTSAVTGLSADLIAPNDTTIVNAKVDGVLIRNNQPGSEFFGNALGIVVGVTPAELISRFVTVSDDLLALG
jgi:Ca2+-binding RTX toxin-like protein